MKFHWEDLFGLAGLLLLLVGSWIGLFGAPPEQWMGDVMRIMYVHVPAAWAALLAFTLAFVAAVGWLFTNRPRWDALLEATVESGVILGALLLALGSLWARPTWNTWWTWDPRLTSMAILEISFLGVLALRGFVDDPDQRSRWSSVAAIFASAGVPLTYFAVKARGIHQEWSNSGTMNQYMVVPLRVNALAFVFLTVWFVAKRFRLARLRQERELALPPELSAGGAA